MLIPREKPYLEGLNSYYLLLDKFTEHLQGEIGSGGIYCHSVSSQILIYFTENEIVRSLLQEQGGKAVFAPAYETIKTFFQAANYTVSVFQLEPHAIFFWGQMPPFQRAKSALKSTEIPLPDLVFRLRQKNFSGFIDVQLLNKQESGLLFFHEGERVGGSYSWGKGGMSTSAADYNTLLSRIQTGEGVFSFGSFIQEKKRESVSTQRAVPEPPPIAAKVLEKTKEETRVVNPVYSELRPPLEEFLFFFTQSIQNKADIDPLDALKEHIRTRVHEFPYLDPLRGFFEYTNGIVKFSSDAPTEKITRAIIACAWDIIRACGAENTFKSELSKMRYKPLLLERNIPITG